MDIEAVRKRLSQLQTSTTRTTNLWKPQPGKTQIRLLPYKLNSEVPFIELFFHYDLGGKTFLSPISFGRPDPIEEFAEKLKSSGNREDWRLGKKLEAKLRTFAPVCVRGEENQGSKFWGFGKTVYQEILGYIADPDYGDITDPTSGRDLTIEYKSAEEAGTSYPTTTIRVKPKASAVTEDEAKVAGFLESQTEITDLYSELSYDELKSVLEGWLNPSGEGKDEGVSQSTLSQSKPTQPTQPAPTAAAPVINAPQKTNDVAAAFDDLFNN